MKTKTFKSFLSDYVKDMNPEHSLSLFKNEKYVQNDSRLLNVYSFYVFFNEDVVATLMNKKNQLPKLFQMYKLYEEKYKGMTYDNVAYYVKSLDDFDELKQLYTSYTNLFLKKDVMLKKMYHQRIYQIQQKKKISNYRIYTDLKLNHGNTNDFLSNKKYNKLSIEKIKTVLKYVTSV